MKKILKNIIGVILIFILVSSIFALFNPDALQKKEEIPVSQLISDIEKEKIEKIEITGEKISAFYKSGEKLISRKERGISFSELLKEYGLREENLKNLSLTVKEEKESFLNWLFPILAVFLPLLIFGWLFWTIFRQTKKGQGKQPFSFLNAPAKKFDKSRKKERVYFKDIADLEEAKQEIKEIIDFLKSPRKYFKMGAQIPRGVLLVGPPGTGKTMLARAVANEANVPFLSMAGSEFIELFVGVGSSRVKNLFQEAKKKQPSIVFIDELDAIGKTRMPGFGGGHEEREQTLNQILSEMDGFERETGVIILAATNRPEQLDPALLRPGRFDRRIVLDLPDIDGRKEILKIHCRNKPLSSNVKLREVAERTPGFSGADLANLANEAAILAARRSKKKISQKEFLESIEKVLLGPERKSHLLSEKEKEISAFHESGHALISYLLPEAEEVRKVSIISRGMAAGYTLSLPKKERKLKNKSEFLAELAVLLGGYCAEKLKFKEITTGASNDLEKATKVARNLVVKFGMSKLGPISFGEKENSSFLGIEETKKNYSEKVATAIDKEIEKFIKEAERKAINLLRKNKKKLGKIAKTLIEKETIEKEEFEKLVKSK